MIPTHSWYPITSGATFAYRYVPVILRFVATVFIALTMSESVGSAVPLTAPPFARPPDFSSMTRNRSAGAATYACHAGSAITTLTMYSRTLLPSPAAWICALNVLLSFPWPMFLRFHATILTLRTPRRRNDRKPHPCRPPHPGHRPDPPRGRCLFAGRSARFLSGAGGTLGLRPAISL